MRLDDIAPRTLLLGGFAGWAVLAWVLALAGMGGRLPPAEPGPVRAAPVPSLPPPADAPALGPISQYAATASRPLFATDRRPHPFSLQGEAGGPAEAPEFDLVLTSVLITPQATMAIVQKPDGSAGWRVRIGEAPEAHPNWTLVRLEPRRAVFQGPEGQKELALRVFDGKGGPTPTAVPGPVNVDPPATMGGVAQPRAVPPPPPPPTGVDAGTKGPADAAAPDPAQIDAIRRRIEQRRRELRERVEQSSPQPATLNPPPPPTEIR